MASRKRGPVKARTAQANQICRLLDSANALRVHRLS